VWPDAAKEKDRYKYTPLHLSCYKRTPLEVVAALLECWPEAVKEKGNFGRTPLRMACCRGASLEVMALMLNTWLSFKENRTKSAIMTLQSYFSTTVYTEEDVKVLFSHLFALFNKDADNPSPNKIMDCFVHIEMWNGATLVLDTNPAVIKTMGLDTKVMADLLSTVGRCCSLKAMWEVLCNEQDLLEDV